MEEGAHGPRGEAHHHIVYTLPSTHILPPPDIRPVTPAPCCFRCRGRLDYGCGANGPRVKLRPVSPLHQQDTRPSHLFHILARGPSFPYESCRLDLLMMLCSSVGRLSASKLAKRLADDYKANQYQGRQQRMQHVPFDVAARAPSATRWTCRMPRALW